MIALDNSVVGAVTHEMQLVFVCDSKIKQNLGGLEHVRFINFEFHLNVFILVLL